MDGGKGSKQRPTDHDAYASNYDRIFGRKYTHMIIDEVDERCVECLSSIIKGECINKHCVSHVQAT